MEKVKTLSFNQAKEIVKELAKSKGFYCRILERLEEMTEENKADFEQYLADYKVKNSMDLMYLLEC